ncbi:MAG TPA: hypothetical protein VFQ16_14385 [Burkholderiaceae bacterium]|nr:hypothetical protein [Burkholderiaceae bacterium]
MNSAQDMRPAAYAPRRSVWPGVLGAALIVATAGGLILVQPDGKGSAPPPHAALGAAPAAVVPAEVAKPAAPGAVATPAPSAESARGASDR